MNRVTAEKKAEVRADREQGMTLTQLMGKHSLARSTVFFLIKGCDASKVSRASPSREVVKEVKHKDRPGLSKTDLGEAARQMMCARMMLAGIKVFRPMTEDTPTDLLVLKRNGEVLKCQCKYLYPLGNGSHRLNLFSIRKNGPNSKAVKHVYREDEVDVFLGYCLDDDSTYVVPYRDCAGRATLSEGSTTGSSMM